MHSYGNLTATPWQGPPTWLSIAGMTYENCTVAVHEPPCSQCHGSGQVPGAPATHGQVNQATGGFFKTGEPLPSSTCVCCDGRGYDSKPRMVRLAEFRDILAALAR